MEKCLNCQKLSNMINSICDHCGFNSLTKKFSWIKINLDKVQGQNMSIENLVDKHRLATQRQS